MSDRKRPCDMKTNKWCITYWLTDGRTIETLNDLVAAMPSNWALEGQIEQGYDSDDKLHAQLFLKTEQTRGTKIIKYFPNCYVDEAKNPFALKNYVHKIDTRVAEFKTVENRSPQWTQVCDKFFDWLLITHDYPSQVKEETEFGQESPRLQLWDQFINLSISEGMRLELIGVNPQYRSAIKRYWIGFIDAAKTRQTSVDRQTDRQELNISVDRQTDRQIPQNSVAEGGVVRRVKFPE